MKQILLDFAYGLRKGLVYLAAFIAILGGILILTTIHTIASQWEAIACFLIAVFLISIGIILIWAIGIYERKTEELLERKD